ncbi:MAG: chloride channel protein [Gemmatimonadota bacterium]|jgi:CIC family chloride channel protein
MKQEPRTPTRIWGLEQLLARARAAEHTFMVMVAAAIGVLGGLGAVLFRLMIRAVQRGAWGEGAFGVELVEAHPWWWVVLAPAAGGILVGLMVRYMAREAKGHGVPEVMEAVILRGGVIRPRLVAVKSIASAVCIGTGGSVGREGPIVQIGSALASAIGRLLGVKGNQLRTLVAAGAAAGIAATFNAPLAGALFGVEIILGNFAVAEFSAIVIASVSATAVSRHFLGAEPLIDVPSLSLVSPWEVIPYSLLGVAAAVVALTFSWSIYKAEDMFDRFPLLPWLTTAVGGLMVGALALAYPQVMGVGYPVTEAAVWGRLSVGLLLVLVPAKLLATSLTLGSGGSGGIFAPSLFLGSLTGGLTGAAANFWAPNLTGPPGAYALVGMGAVVAGATHAPLTAILMIFELTSDYRMILPLMASCMIANLITARAREDSIYTRKLVRRGVDVHRGRAVNVLRSLQVSDVMKDDMITVGEGERLGSILGRVSGDTFPYLYVMGEDDKFVGLVELGTLRQAIVQADELGALLVARDLAREDVPTVSPDQNLDLVSRIFGGRDLEELPVVDPENHRLLGFVASHHLLEAYNREIMRRDAVRSISGSLEATATYEVMLGDGYSMAQVEAPKHFVGHSLKDLDLRARDGIAVLLVRRSSSEDGKPHTEVMPGPDTRIEEGDSLVVVGMAEALVRLRQRSR